MFAIAIDWNAYFSMTSYVKNGFELQSILADN